MDSRQGNGARRVDFHVHLAGDGSSGSGVVMTPRMRRRPATWYLLWSMGLPLRCLGVDGDRRYLDRAIRWLDSARHVDLGLLLALDRIYRDDGSPDDRRLELYVPNDYVLGVARRHPRVMAGISVHPYRRDAIDELTRCAEQGAAAVKWIPVSQNIDPADRRCDPFFDRMAELGLPLLCHTGSEHAFSTVDSRLRNPEILRPALDRGVRVVAAHCGMNVLPREPSYLEHFIRLLKSYPNLFGDCSALCLPRRPAQIRRVLDHPLVLERLVHGSDYPISIRAWWMTTARMPLFRALRLDREPNPLDRDVMIKRELGLPEAVFTRGAELLKR